jgi:hypothetical protein
MAQRVPFIVADLGADAEAFMLHLYAALAEKERTMISSHKGCSRRCQGRGQKLGKRLLFVSPKRLKSIECYERLAYKEGTSEPDKESGYDHLPDSAGYYFFARFSRKPVFRTNAGHMHR